VIRSEVVLHLFHAELAPDEASQQQLAQQRSGGNGNLHYEHETSAGAEVIDAALAGGVSTAAVGGAVAAPRPVQASAGEKIGRNDPCWCGSGKKFKKCHGA
jgi:preprotein translocase subunit SecA